MLLLQILSTEPDHLRVANGIIAEIGNSHVSVSTSVWYYIFHLHD